MRIRLYFIAGILIFCSGVAMAEPTCLEECVDLRHERLREYRECLNEAKRLPDRLAQVKHKRYCRKRFPIPSCDGLPACKKQKGKVDAIGDAKHGMSLISARIFSSRTPKGVEQAYFYPGQTLYVGVALNLGQNQGDRFHLDQTILILDESGKEVFSNTEAFTKAPGMSSTYKVKSSVVIPKKFKVGKYKLKLLLHERVSRWQGSHEADFSVVK